MNAPVTPTVDELAWYCLKSQPKREHIAAAHLRQMGKAEVFSPRLRFQRATVRGARWFEESMFPGYLFARFHFAESHKLVRSAMGVSQIVQFGGRYASIADEVIESLRGYAGPKDLAIANYELREGDTVKIVAGSLVGLEAAVTQILSGRERVRLLLEFLGRSTYAEVDMRAVLPAIRHPLAA